MSAASTRGDAAVNLGAVAGDKSGPVTQTEWQYLAMTRDGAGAGSYQMMTAALGLLTATHADSRMAWPVTMDYLAGVPTDRGSGSLLLFRMRFHMRFQQLEPSPG